MLPVHPAVPDGYKARIEHGRVTLEDGHTVGVSVGGAGVPLVFLHGIGLNRRTYLRLLSRLPQFGFLVIALDAADHGQTAGLPRGRATFLERARLVDRTLDALGVRRAVLMGHSMGGRMAAELTAARPERSIATVLLDAAVGEAFDLSRDRGRRPWLLARALLEAAYDSARDGAAAPAADRRKYRRAMSGSVRASATRPWRLRAAAGAVATAPPSRASLDAIKRASSPVFVVHGERDLVVPLESARDAARRTGGVLLTLPGAYHSWMLANPYSFSAVVERLMEAGLHDVVAHALPAEGLRAVPSAYAVHGRLLRKDAALYRLLSPVEVIGRAGAPPGAAPHDVVLQITRGNAAESA
jgi:pimeloyl-ACP methyl ester carboxylesterase